MYWGDLGIMENKMETTIMGFQESPSSLFSLLQDLWHYLGFLVVHKIQVDFAWARASWPQGVRPCQLLL